MFWPPVVVLLIGSVAISGSDTFVVDKTIGKTRITDDSTGDDVLDLKEFTGDDEVSDILIGFFEETLVLENSEGGVVGVDDFFSDSGTPIQFVDLGDGLVDVSFVDRL